MQPVGRLGPVKSQPALLRILGLGFGIAVVIGGVVGQGIMRTPGIVAGALPDGRIIIAAWFLGGLLAFIDSFASIELASAVPRAGGPYAFAARAFGPLVGTIVGWSDWLKGMTVLGFQAVVFAEYVQRLKLPVRLPTGVLAVVLVGLVCGVNFLGTRVSGVSQNVGSALKALALVALVVLFLAAGQATDVSPLAHRHALSLAGLIIAMRAVYTTYDGWSTAVYFGEELKAPERNIARATFTGIAVVTVLYVLVNLGLLHVLSTDQISASTLPAADAATAVLGGFGGTLITLLAVVSVAAIANLQAMFLTRVAYGMARDGVMMRALARVARSGTPRFALFATALGGALFAATGVYEHLIAISVPLAITTNAATDLAAIRLRLREPGLPRPFRMPLFPLPALLGLAINGALLVALIIEDPVHSSLGLLLLMGIGAGYYVRSRWSKSSQAC
jgi:APA family basic amino acid/polyamine antiporter